MTFYKPDRHLRVFIFHVDRLYSIPYVVWDVLQLSVKTSTLLSASIKEETVGSNQPHCVFLRLKQPTVYCLPPKFANNVGSRNSHRSSRHLAPRLILGQSFIVFQYSSPLEATAMDRRILSHAKTISSELDTRRKLHCMLLSIYQDNMFDRRELVFLGTGNIVTKMLRKCNCQLITITTKIQRKLEKPITANPANVI